jgi:hypothetical protein
MPDFKNIPGRPVTDPDNGLGADVVVDGGVNRLAVDATGTFTGTVQVAPPTDRRFLTTAVSGAPTAISFAGFDITGINIKSSQDSDGPIRLGESDLDTSSAFTILEPGEVWNAELNGTLSPVFVMFDTGTTTATVHVTALGNPTP